MSQCVSELIEIVRVSQCESEVEITIYMHILVKRATLRVCQKKVAFSIRTVVLHPTTMKINHSQT